MPAGLAKIHEAASAGRAHRLVLADAVMPGIDGFTLANRLVQDSRLAGSVILMLSATDRQNYPEQCRALKTPCLEKPVSRSALFDLIAKVLGAEGRLGSAGAVEAGRILPVPRRVLRVLLTEDCAGQPKGRPARSGHGRRQTTPFATLRACHPSAQTLCRHANNRRLAASAPIRPLLPRWSYRRPFRVPRPRRAEAGA